MGICNGNGAGDGEPILLIHTWFIPAALSALLALPGPGNLPNVSGPVTMVLIETKMIVLNLFERHNSHEQLVAFCHVIEYRG